MRTRPPVWLWLNLLSLDAPLVALVWQDFLARCYPTTLHPQGRAALGLTVWAIYLADRIIDVSHAATATESMRHRFYRHHRTVAKALFALVILTDLLITLTWLRPTIMNNGMLVSAGVIAYLAIFPLTRWGAPASKKPLAALLFTAGTFLIAWTGIGQPIRHLALPAAAFCALCLGNLLLVGRWSRVSRGHSTGGPAWLLFAVFVVIAIVTIWSSSWFAAIVASAAGLCALAQWGQEIPGDARCVLADAVLLTPLLFRGGEAGLAIARLFEGVHAIAVVALRFR